MKNVEIRAKRILSALPSYQTAAEISEAAPAGSEAFGSLIGRYQNIETEVGTIWFFETAIVWATLSAVIYIPFKEVEHVGLSAEKESEELALKMRDGRDILLPVEGKRGRFFDSMEVLRFFDRVLADLRS
jgi:hypothetical protein